LLNFEQISKKNRMNSKKLWDQEYQSKKNIASTFKGTVSRSVQFLLDYLKKHDLNLENFLDLGCGNGRNAIPLTKLGYNIVGMDISKVAVKQGVELAQKECSQQPVFIVGSMAESLPFRAAEFDVVMDITSFDILINQKEIECHKNETHRVLKPDGLFLYYDMAKDDSYAIDRMTKSSISDQNCGVIYTPTGIPFKTRCQKDIESIFNNFKTVSSKVFRFHDKMDGEIYDRSILCMIMKKRSK